MMPELTESNLLKVRESKNLPIILPAKSEDADKISDWTAGADDYITKPFNLSGACCTREKPAAALHPAGRDADKRRLPSADWCLTPSTKSVTVDGEAVRLTPPEYKNTFARCAVIRARCSPPRRFTDRCGMITFAFPYLSLLLFEWLFII